MKNSLCTGCARKLRPRDGDRVRCLECSEWAKVREHQLHKRRAWRESYKRHTCHLCRKWKDFVKQIVGRWDERDIYVVKKCSKGHEWMKWNTCNSCSVCRDEWNQKYVKELRAKGVLP